MDDLVNLLANLFDVFETDFLPGFNRFLKKRFLNFKTHFFERTAKHHFDLINHLSDKINNLENTIRIVETVPNFDKERLESYKKDLTLYKLEKERNQEILNKITTLKGVKNDK